MIRFDHCIQKGWPDIAHASAIPPIGKDAAYAFTNSLLALSLALAGAASAQPLNPRQAPTESEKAACEPDAVRLCSSTYPDADKMLDCMKANKTALTLTCRKAFEEGLKRRGL